MRMPMRVSTHLVFLSMEWQFNIQQNKGQDHLCHCEVRSNGPQRPSGMSFLFLASKKIFKCNFICINKRLVVEA